jgi:aldehyde dehydrogenase (NAD+)
MRDPRDEPRLNDRPVTSLETPELAATLETQRRFFSSGATRSARFRRDQLQSLVALVTENLDDIHEALRADLGKPTFEAYASESGLVLSEARFALEHLDQWMEPVRVPTPLVLFPATSYIHAEPLGLVLVIGPWNYPFQLMMAPLAGAIAAGNCVFLKPSEWAVQTSRLVGRLARKYFPPELVSTATGGVETGTALLEERFDHIFFTGSATVARVVAAAAAKYLTPVTLELGGKSPAIVDEDVNLERAARRIAWGKFLNAGQTCIAPDYVLVPSGLKGDFLAKLRKYIGAFFGDNPEASPDFGRIVNRRHFDRLVSYLSDGAIVTGGQTDRDHLYIAPTIIAAVPDGAPVLSEEIFGPILPLLTYDGLDEAIARTSLGPDPLALYFFSNDRQHQDRILRDISFGGGAINDTLLQFSNPNLPFGGRGSSGIGTYHGRFSFDLFSHKKAVVKGSLLFDPPIRYPPYRSGKLGWLRKLLK